MESLQIERLTALGHAGRMALFRLLVRRYPEYVAAGELARSLSAKPNTMSVHLAALSRAGLLEQKRDGRSVLYRADMEGAEDLIAYLFEDCCRGRPQICAARTDAQPAKASENGKLNVLFICSGNSARSIFAESILRQEAGERFNVYSAGTSPRSTLNPFAVELLKAKGHDTSRLRAKHISEFQGAEAPKMDFVFTVCDQAANEECAAWRGQPISAHWGVADPVKATGTDAEKRLAFQQAYGQLRNRIRPFAALPFATLDRASLQRHVDEISQEGESS